MNVWPNNAWYDVDPYGSNGIQGILQVGCALALLITMLLGHTPQAESMSRSTLAMTPRP